MRYIPTSAVTVEALKKQAKKIQRKSGGKHADNLDRAAQKAGYLHWHHVTLCNKQTESKSGFEALRAECDIILRAAREGVDKVIASNSAGLQAGFIFFAAQGDAWMLDPEEDLLLCLRFQGQEENLDELFEDTPRQILVRWDGMFALDGEAFAVSTNHQLVGQRIILGYPLAELRKWIDRLQSSGRRMLDVIVQRDAVDITDELAARLVANGWEPKVIQEAIQEGMRYSPSRNTLLTPQIMGFGDEFEDDDDDDEPWGGVDGSSAASEERGGQPRSE